jgi:GTP-binding protein SAR1
LTDKALKGVPFLILGNRVDKEGCVPAEVLAAHLGITYQTAQTATSVPPGQRPIRVFPCSVKQKAGYADGFRWLAKFI